MSEQKEEVKVDVTKTQQKPEDSQKTTTTTTTTTQNGRSDNKQDK